MQALIRGNDALVDQGMALTRANRLLDEQRRIGENIVDTIFDPSNWDDWGEMGKRILQMLLQEMLVLAAVNPLKNALFDSGLPTLGDGGGFLGFLGGIFGNASGTEWSSGGWRRVGEFGEELVRLPRGAQVMNAGRTRQADRTGAARPISISYQIDATGADAAGLRRVEDAIERLNSSIEARSVSAVMQAHTDTFGQIWG